MSFSPVRFWVKLSTGRCVVQKTGRSGQIPDSWQPYLQPVRLSRIVASCGGPSSSRIWCSNVTPTELEWRLAYGARNRMIGGIARFFGSRLRCSDENCCRSGVTLFVYHAQGKRRPHAKFIAPNQTWHSAAIGAFYRLAKQSVGCLFNLAGLRLGCYTGY